MLNTPLFLTLKTFHLKESRKYFHSSRSSKSRPTYLNSLLKEKIVEILSEVRNKRFKKKSKSQDFEKIIYEVGNRPISL